MLKRIFLAITFAISFAGAAFAQVPANVGVTTVPGIPITGNATGTTGAVTGTLAAGGANKITYICGFNVSAIGGTAAVGPITIANLVTSSMVYQLASSGRLVPD